MNQPNNASEPTTGQQVAQPGSSQPSYAQTGYEQSAHQPSQSQFGYDQAANQPPYQQSGYQPSYQQGPYPGPGQQYGSIAQAQQYPSPAYGYRYPAAAAKRPGIATATGVIGIIMGVGSFGYAAAALIGAAIASDDPDKSVPGGLLVVLWIVGICAVAASVMIFVGAIQILNGSNTFVLRIGSALALIAIWTLAIYGLTGPSGSAPVVTIIVGAILGSIFPVLVLLFSLSSVVTRWVRDSRARHQVTS